ncbi:MAG: hypothetical protein ABUM51_06160, partial [Bacteroidota bacterium]
MQTIAVKFLQNHTIVCTMGIPELLSNFSDIINQTTYFMRHFYLLTLLYMFLFSRQSGFSQSNAAPSEHLTYSFPNDAVLKMHKVKIVQSAFASYFEVQSFTNGYAGLQLTPDSSHGSSHILISSLWDPNTSGGIYSVLDYAAPNTYTGR